MTPPRDGRPSLPEDVERTLTELRGTVSEQDRMLRQLRSQLAEREAILAAVLSSRSWKLLQRLQNLRHRIAPRGSRRGEMLERVLYLIRDLLRAPTRIWGRFSSWLRLLPRRLAGKGGGRSLRVEEIRPASATPRRTAEVDVIVCVHNALDDVRACLESLVRWTLPPYRLILVDDGSADATRGFLEEFAAAQGCTLLRNPEACGYTRAANRGLRESQAPFVVLLNSDTIVSPRWLDRMVACAESDPKIGLVGPLSNTASWQSVPEIFDDDGDWAENPLSEGLDVASMADRVAESAGPVYPRIPFLNGFCILVKRRVLDAVGLLDESTFPDGFGEENDLCLRSAKAGFQLAVADDTYVFHAQSRSYSHERRLELVARTDAVVAQKHGPALVAAGADACRTNPELAGIRARVRAAAVRSDLVAAGQRRWEGRRVLFVLPIAEPGGGGHVVIQEAMAMMRMGVDVRLLNLTRFKGLFAAAHPDLVIPVTHATAPSASTFDFGAYDAVVATVFHSVPWLDWPRGAGPVRAYYIQDFEPLFFHEGSPEHVAASASYTLHPDLVRVTKTEWNRKRVLDHCGAECTVVGPSVDIDLFRPRPRTGSRHPRVRVAAMIRPSTARRQPALTMRVLRDLVRETGAAVEVVLFGCDLDDPALASLSTDFPWRHAGVLTRPKLAALLPQIDIFVDLSAHQAMGLTALEAMASGTSVILPAEGGAASFARHEENALIVDAGDAAACRQALERLVDDDQLRRRLARQGLEDACIHFPERAAFRLLEALFPG